MSRRLLVPMLSALVLITGACSTGPSATPATTTVKPQAAVPPPVTEPPVDPDLLTITESEGPLPAEFLEDRRLHLGVAGSEPLVLDAPPHPALQGTLSPLAVRSPDGRFLAYSTYTEVVAVDPDRPLSGQGVAPGDPLGIPAVRLRDLSTGKEQVTAEGAYSAAWRHDGALAYVQGDDPAFRAGTAYTGQVWVRPSPDAEPEQWTFEEGRYVVVAWAGDTLIYYRTTGNESFDLEGADGVGQERTLSSEASLIALSPDGTRAAVATNANGRSSRVDVVDVATGQVTASTGTGPLVSLIYGGSWVGSTIVARGGDRQGALLAVLQVGGDEISLNRVLRVDGRYRVGLDEPQLDAADPSKLTAWTFVPQGRSGYYLVLRCDLRAVGCHGRRVGAKVVRLAYTPSR